MSINTSAIMNQSFSHPIVLSAAVLVLLFFTYYIQGVMFARKHGCKRAVAVPDSAYLGIPLLLKTLKNKSQGRLMEFAQEKFAAVGDTFLVYVLRIPIHITQDPENVKAIIATQFNDFALGTRHAHFKPLLGDGIFTLDGEGWRHSRAMLRPQFAREQVSHVKGLEPHIQILAQHIRNAKGKSLDLQELFFRLTVDTATQFLFGESVDSLVDETISDNLPKDFDGKAGFADHFNLSQSYLSTRAYLQDIYFLVNNREFKESNKKVHKFASYYVNKALNATPEELEKKSESGYIFLYELVKQTRDPKVLQDQLLNILLAGRDTTAGLLSFTFYELARNPHIWEKLKREIYESFGDGENARIEDITFESLKKCEYLKWVVNEALRLYPSVPINFRVATKNTTLPRGGGPDGQSPIFIRKGRAVAYVVFCTHRMKSIYGEDALEFKPERWADLKKVGWGYVPFNGGPRICLGQQFALTETSYVIARLTQMFPNLHSTDTRPYPPAKNVQLTMCLQDGLHVSLS